MSNVTSIPSKERIAILDVLRGLALFGVLVGIFSEYIFLEITISYDGAIALSTYPIDTIFKTIIQLFITNKANTLFAFLFGLGFFIQWERIQERQKDAKAIYLRRTFILLVFGAFHLFVMLAWEVLFMYGIIAFILFLMRNKSDKFLLYWGLFLALFGLLIVGGLIEYFELWKYYPAYEIYDSNGWYIVMDGQWGYVPLFNYLWGVNWYEGVLNGGTLSYIVYALGRFMLGTFVGRKGWIQNTDRYLSGFKKALLWTLPLGLLLGYWSVDVIENYYNSDLEEMPSLVEVAHLVDPFAILLTAAGYVCLVVVGMNNAWFSKILSVFAPVGKMALTNYVIMCQSVNLTYFSVGPGLGLAGKIGATHIFGISVFVFLVLTVTSNIWLKYFRFGPLEWCWRALTYGALPTMLISSSPK